ncbi:restriction endonuclease subunit S [Aliifodinibius sp. S!AR15-10]|uniref:restriction endonuclease subunit S n=1 Tax=Aliifodinibius sp. S!AR15-10 TaxID=2950437 RepID=UPI00285E06EB|nr:restriction endonuclease subunit S [Aliifodinibius sp. S!AR15-10]MDR8394617.1 restriction endonuclease subunit S [Aliifodinibius sp. S!AR15-10]
MKLNEIANISTGYSFRSKIKHDSEGDTKVIQMSDVDKYRGIIPEGLQSISGFEPRKDRYFLEGGDVIMISKGYNINAFVVPPGLGRVVAVNSFIVLKPDKYKLLPEYLAWFLNSNRTQHFFKAVSAGTNIPNLSIRALKGLDINPPSIERQEKLAELDRLKRREIALHQEIASKKEKLVDTMLQQQADKWKSNN